MKFYLLFFILISNQLFSQSFAPIITNYPKSEYLGESPIWDIAENKKNGTIFFANNRNILAYDGNFWEKISTNNLAITRSVAIINQVIYSGSLNNFGYWKLEKGTRKYVSISDQFNSFKGLEQEEIWKIFYHQKNPLELIEACHKLVKPEGVLILETMVVDGEESSLFFPPDRYAKARNVYFLPTISSLKSILCRSGFKKSFCSAI